MNVMTTLVTPRRLPKDVSPTTAGPGSGVAATGEVDRGGRDAVGAVNGAEAVKMSLEPFESPVVSKLAPLSK